MVPPIVLFPRIALVIHGGALFNMNFRNVWYTSFRNAMGILRRIALNLYKALGIIAILLALIVLTEEQGMCLHLLMFSFISWSNVLYFPLSRSIFLLS